MKKKVITLIRHAESENNQMHEKFGEGYANFRKADPRLTKEGELQAKLLREYFRKNIEDFKFELVLVSPMLRTMQTSKILFDDFKAVKQVSGLIYEVKGPYEQDKVFPGLSRSTYIKEFPEYQLPDLVTEQGWYHKKHIEKPEESADRAKQLIKVIASDNKHTRIAIITHGNFLSLFFTVLAKEYLLKDYLNTCPVPKNTSLSTLIITQQGCIIKDFSITPHLDISA